MDVRGLAGTDRAYARFWNHLHSIESALSSSPDFDRARTADRQGLGGAPPL